MNNEKRVNALRYSLFIIHANQQLKTSSDS